MTSTPTTILILDTATDTGWCVTVDGLVVATGLLHFDSGIDKKTVSGAFQKHPLILRRAYADLLDLVEQYRPDFIVAECPHLRGGGSFLTVGIYAVAQLLSAHASCGFYGVHTSEWQSRIIPKIKGVDDGTKDRSLARVKGMGFNPESDDVADAICIAEYVHTILRIGGETFGFQSGLGLAA